MKLSFTEENYLKQIYRLSRPGKPVNTNAIALCIQTKASSVTDMLDKLCQKKMVAYEKYKGASLTATGKKTAIEIIRKHRLWEVFLVEKLGFTWDKVHEIAEQLEHIQSEELIDKLDIFLDYPKFDPHGDPIPDKNGNIITSQTTIPLAKAKTGLTYIITSVVDENESFLQFLTEVALTLNTAIRIKNRFSYNASMEIEIIALQKTIVLDENTQHKLMISKQTHGTN